MSVLGSISPRENSVEGEITRSLVADTNTNIPPTTIPQTEVETSDERRVSASEGGVTRGTHIVGASDRPTDYDTSPDVATGALVGVSPGANSSLK